MGEYENGTSLHTATGDKLLDNKGVGKTVTESVWLLVHPFAVKTKLYVTTTGELDVLINVSLIVLVPDALVLEIFASPARVQAKVVPGVVLAAV